MGTIRNRMIIVQHWNKEELEEARNDAINTFQKLINEETFMPIKADGMMVSFILPSLINSEYTFVINGECSKIGWDESEKFQKARIEWCEKWKEKLENVLIVDFGEDFAASVQEFKMIEEE